MEQTKAIPSAHREISLPEWKNLFLQAPTAIQILRGPEFIYELVNERSLEILRKTKEEVIGRRVVDIMPEAEQQGYLDLLRLVYNTGKTYVAEEAPLHFMSHGKNIELWVKFVFEPLKNEQGTITGVMIMGDDVTQQVQARKKIEESEALLRKTKEQLELSINAGRIGIWHWDVKKNVMNWSQVQMEIFGVTPEEFNGRAEDFFDYIVPEDRAKISAATRLEFERSDNEYEFRIRRKDGTIRWIHSRSKTFLNKDGVAEYITGINIDVTEQKTFATKLRTEVSERTKELVDLNEVLKDKNIELANAQSFLEQIIDSSVEFISVLDADLNYITVNRRFEEVLNVSRHKMHHTNLYEWTPKMRGTAQEAAILRALKGETVHLDNRQSITKPKLFVDTYYVPLIIQDNVQGVIIMARDVTDIVASEKELENKNRLLTEAQHIAQLGSWELNYETNEVRWSDEVYSIYEYKERLPLTLEKAMERMLPEERATSKARMKLHAENAIKSFKEKGTLNFEIPATEYSILLPDGSRKILKSISKIIMSEDGKINKMVGTIQNITEQKKAEAKIRTMNSQLNEAQQIANLGSWHWNLPTNELHWSDNLYQIYGIDPGETISYEKFQSMIHPEDRPYVNKLVEAAMHTKHFHPFYHRIITTSGEVKTLHAREEVLVDNQGNVTGMKGTGQDVTKEKIVEDNLLETNKKLEERNRFVEKLINSSLDLIMVVDTDLKFITLNKKASTLFASYFNQDPIGKIVTELNPYFANTDSYHDLLAAFQGEVIIRDKVRSTFSDNYYEHNYVPLQDYDGKVYAVMVISHDITENMKQMEELKRALESDKLKSDFIKMASHELKTPITSIKGYVQLLLEMVKDKDEKQNLSPLFVKSSLVNVEKQVNRLTRLMSELLDLSKIESGQLQLNSEHFNLNELVIDVVQDVLYTNPKQEINIYHDFTSTIIGDKDRIGQVLVNLLTNAIKYSPDADKVEVIIFQPKKNWIAISVKDFGIGIEKIHHQKIFERFYRAEGAAEQTFPGFGIGLFIAKEMVVRHEGAIWVESEKGKGSVFTFTLPTTANI